MKREDAERSGKAGNTQRGEDGTEELTHGKLLVMRGDYRAGLRTDFDDE
jgi:hypothetical protein